MSHTSHPLLRDRHEGQAPVSDSELLFDLIYVFSVTQLSHYLLHHLSWGGGRRLYLAHVRVLAPGAGELGQPERMDGRGGGHLAERSRLFVIIAFGETILMTGSSFSELDTWNGLVIATTLLSFICSLVMWWVYFDIAGEAGSLKIRKTADPGLLGLKYQAIHVVLVGSLIGCAVGDELAIRHPFDRPTVPVLLAMVGAPMVYLASNVVYKWLISKQIVWSHLGAIGLLGILFFVSSGFTLLGLNGCVTLVFIGVVVYETIRFRHSDMEAIVEV